VNRENKDEKRRHGALSDRRRMPRGGRRAFDRPGQHPAVLIADSYKPARVPCARYLQHFHFRVNEAADAEEVIERILAVPPRLIIMEQRLPVMEASTLRDWLAGDHRTRHIPIIVTTSDFNIGADARMEGMAGLLAKPFALATMISDVRRVLRAEPESE
jgi:CheY-like chemotaxis protein